MLNTYSPFLLRYYTREYSDKYLKNSTNSSFVLRVFPLLFRPSIFSLIYTCNYAVVQVTYSGSEFLHDTLRPEFSVRFFFGRNIWYSRGHINYIIPTYPEQVGTWDLYSAEVHVTCILLKRTLFGAILQNLISIPHQMIWISLRYAETDQERDRFKGGYRISAPGARLSVWIFCMFFFL